MILFTFSQAAKTRLKVWPDICDICYGRSPVTHIDQAGTPTPTNPTGNWVDKICAECSIKYVTEDGLSGLAQSHNAVIEADFEEGDL